MFHSLATASEPAQIAPSLMVSGALQESTPLLSAMSVPLIDPAMMLACLPLGGWWPDTVPGPIWLLEETT